jgi:hypothetical protein
MVETMTKMNLESLANEILLDLFEFFHTVDVFHIFHGLNSRFNTLLFVHYRRFHLDFRSISRNDFDLICGQYLPSIADRIVSLCLSDDDDTPQQTDLFRSRNLNFLQFIHLRSLSLYHIRSNLILRALIDEWHHLSDLTHLNIIECNMDWRNRSPRLIDEIWRLSKLTHCRIRITAVHYILLPVPTIVSSSLRFFSINSYTACVQDLASLIEHTPHLRRLHIHLSNEHRSQDLQSKFSSLIVLKITNTGPVERLMNFLKSMPNLTHLTINTQNKLDGSRWEQIISNYLPSLKVFRLKMEFTIRRNKEQQIDELLSSFRSRFWLTERRWFVRCHWYPGEVSKHASLFTLPYTFSEFVLNTEMLTKSTCPNENDYYSYDHVHSLSYTSSLSTLRFCNIRHLYLKFPFNDEFWSTVPKLDQLTSVCLCMHNNAEALLQTLLQRAPHLSSLTYDSSSSITPSELILLNSKLIIHRLDLQGYNHWFNEDECSQLSRSLLGIHCKVLRIKVKNRTSILDLVETMINLCALNVQCQDDDCVEDDHVDEDDIPYNDDLGDIFLPRQEELVRWLRHRLPIPYLILRDANKIDHVRIWLR